MRSYSLIWKQEDQKAGDCRRRTRDQFNMYISHSCLSSCFLSKNHHFESMQNQSHPLGVGNHPVSTVVNPMALWWMPTAPDVPEPHLGCQSFMLPLITPFCFEHNCTLTHSPRALTHKRSFYTMVESNGIKNVGHERELGDHEQPPSNFKTSHLHSSSSLADSSPPNHDVHIVDMGYPMMRVDRQPTAPGRTPSRIMTHDVFIINSIVHHRFLVVEVSDSIIESGHITYLIQDLTYGRYVYLLVPHEWTVVENEKWWARVQLPMSGTN